MVKFQKYIKMFVSMILVILSFCIPVMSFAEETTTEAPQQITEQISEETTDTVFETPVEPSVDIPVETVPATVPSTAQNQNPIKEKYKIMFLVYGVEHVGKISVTVVSEETKEEYKLLLTQVEDYVTSTELPVGNYKIEKIKTDDKFKKVSFDISEFSVKQNDMQSYSINATQTEINFFLKLLYRNWAYIVILAVLLIVLYRINKKKIA